MNLLAIFLFAPLKSAGVLIPSLINFFINISFGLSFDMDKEYAKHLLEKTHQDYNTIGELFSKTRSYVWGELEVLGQYTFAGERVLDLGCGNGRLWEVFEGKDIDYVGTDTSERLIEMARQQYPKTKFLKANALKLPFPPNYFDKIYSIAVFHHIPSKEFRLKFLNEAKRVLKPEGLLVLTVWNLFQKRFLKYHLKFFFLKLISRSKLDFKDVFYPWKSPDGKVIIQRYLHCFTKGELKRLAKRAGFKIKEIGFLGKGNRNIYLIAEKPS